MEDTPCTAFTAVMEDSIPAVENVTQENRCATVNKVAALTDTSVGSLNWVVSDELNFQKLCSRWVPQRLTPEMRGSRIDAYQELLHQYEASCEAFL